MLSTGRFVRTSITLSRLLPVGRLACSPRTQIAVSCYRSDGGSNSSIFLPKRDLRTASWPMPVLADHSNLFMSTGRVASVGPLGILKRVHLSIFRRSASTTASETVESGHGRRTVDAPIVGYWTLFCASMVFGIIVWGGLTRLTESGLSIVEWAPITGAKLPTSDAAWEAEFEKYKQFPEYHKVHIGITLDDFKKIYFMEWFHRNIGRLFGVVYLVPAAYFVSKGLVSRAGIAKIGGLGLLLLGQGAMGWYMVASGLEKELGERPDAVPR
ncbi:Cytochrome c oxidase assembly protein cox15, partial [Coemansia sp. S142-1]